MLGRFTFIFFLPIFLLSTLSFAQGGSGVGNGGMGVRCKNKDEIVVLDYFLGNRKHLSVQLDRFETRADFFSFVTERLNETFYGRQIVPLLTDRWNRFGESKDWPTAIATRTFDEALSDQLPKGCHLVQLAVYQPIEMPLPPVSKKPEEFKKWLEKYNQVDKSSRPHRIELPANQKQRWMLELHEALYSASWEETSTFYQNGYQGERNDFNTFLSYNASATRRLIGYLFKQVLTGAKLNLESKSFLNPGMHWSYLGAVPNKMQETLHGYPSMVIGVQGVFELTKSSGQSTDTKRLCPEMLAFAPSADPSNYLYARYRNEEDKITLKDLTIAPGVRYGSRYTTKVDKGQNSIGGFTMSMGRTWWSGTYHVRRFRNSNPSEFLDLTLTFGNSPALRFNVHDAKGKSYCEYSKKIMGYKDGPVDRWGNPLPLDTREQVRIFILQSEEMLRQSK